MVSGEGGDELTAQETAVYDRQIRVWGVDAQKRLSKSHVLIAGISGAAVEVCKNVVLAGVGSVTLVDDRPVTEEAVQANFLIPPDESKREQGSIADLCCDSLKEFNPMVSVSAITGNVRDFDEEFFDKFDVVVVSSFSLAAKKKINNMCRRRAKRIAFYSIECRGWCGEIFADLQEYAYVQKTSDGAAESGKKYPSFEEAISVPWKSLPKRTAKLFFAIRVVESFELSAERKHGEVSSLDMPDILAFRKQICEAQDVSESLVPTATLEQLLSAGSQERPPVCAILGGILAQEIIKGISGKGEPIKNFFFFDTMDGKGVIEDISPAE